nr:hypothetical protein CFP56_41284 [Quercus suber]
MPMAIWCFAVESDSNSKKAAPCLALSQHIQYECSCYEWHYDSETTWSRYQQLAGMRQRKIGRVGWMGMQGNDPSYRTNRRPGAIPSLRPSLHQASLDRGRLVKRPTSLTY